LTSTPSIIRRMIPQLFYFFRRFLAASTVHCSSAHQRSGTLIRANSPALSGCLVTSAAERSTMYLCADSLLVDALAQHARSMTMTKRYRGGSCCIEHESKSKRNPHLPQQNCASTPRIGTAAAASISFLITIAYDQHVLWHIGGKLLA
jgi:hypothetical protein